tara:strand:- start:574 stop:897 length:324 start_codon:yes stop_codon:yes gene_type:complete
MNFDIWTIIGVAVVILLIIFWRGRNAIWGGLTLGIIVGFIITIFNESGFDWSIIVRGAVLGAIIGFVTELLGRFSDFIKMKKTRRIRNLIKKRKKEIEEITKDEKNK